MPDPFRPDIHRQLYREAQVGLIIVLLLLVVLAYVILYKSSRLDLGIPDHVRESPIAQSVWPFSEDDGSSPRHPSLPPSPIQQASIVGTNAPDFSAERQPRETKTLIPNNANLDSQLVSIPVTPGANVQPSVSKKTDKVQLLDPDEGIFEHHRPLSDPDFFAKQLTQSESSTEKSQSVPSPSVQLASGDIPHRDFQPDFQQDLQQAVDNNESQLAADTDLLDPFQPASTDDPNVSFTTHTTALSQETEPIKDTNQDKSASSANLNDFQPLPRPSHRPTPQSPLENPTDRLKAEAIVSTGTDRVSPPADGVAETAGNFLPQIYSVQKGDSFWSISQHFYQDGNFFRALYQHNAENVDRFELSDDGTQIEIPLIADLRRQFPDLCPEMPAVDDSNRQQANELRNSNSQGNRNYYVTQEDENLFDIAARELGQASRYLEIIELNQSILPNRVGHLTPLPANLRLQLSTN